MLVASLRLFGVWLIVSIASVLCLFVVFDGSFCACLALIGTLFGVCGCVVLICLFGCGVQRCG